MISAWKRRDNYWTNIDSPDFVQGQMYTGYLETRRHGLSGLNEHKKNKLWMLWESTPKPLRQEGSGDDHTGCSEGVEAGLAYGEGIRQGIHAETASTESCCSTWGNRDRRDILTERAYLSDCYQRLGEETAYLVWRRRSV